MKRTTPVKTITLMAMIAALNVIFSFVASLMPLAGLFLAIALPLASAMVVLKTDLRYYPIYAIATLGLSLIVTMQQLETTLFYVFPSLLLGFVFGFLYKRRADDISIIIVTSFLQLAILYGTIGLINAIFMIDFTSTLALILNLTSTSDLLMLPLVLYIVSLSQVTITYFIITSELEKLSQTNYAIKYPHKLTYTLGLIITLAIVPLGFVIPSISFVLLGPSFILSGSALYELIVKRRWTHTIVLSVWALLSVFAFAILFPLFNQEIGLLWLCLIPIGALTIRLCDFYLPKRRQGHTINSRGQNDPVS